MSVKKRRLVFAAGLAAALFIFTTGAGDWSRADLFETSAEEFDSAPDSAPDNATENAAEASQPLFLKVPFNRLTLTSHYNGVSFQVLPIEFPHGIRPNPLPRLGELSVRFVSDPFKEFHVKWNFVEKIELFSELVQQEFLQRLETLSEGVRNSKPDDEIWISFKQDFELMFDYLLYLKDYKEELKDYATSYRKFLFEEAEYQIKSRNFLTGLARYERLYREDKNHPGLENAWGAAMNLLLEQEQAEGNSVKCREFLIRFKEFYPEHEVVRAWEERLLDTTRTLCRQSREAFESHDFFEAHRLCDFAMEIIPTLPELLQWQRRLRKTAPRIDIAVDVAIPPPSRLIADTVPDRGVERGRRLLCKILAEYTHTGSGGGIYRTSLGSLDETENHRELQWTFTDPTDAVSAVESIQSYWKPSGPPFDPLTPFATRRFLEEVLSSAELLPPDRLRVRLKNPFLIPKALFVFPLLSYRSRFELETNDGNENIPTAGPTGTVLKPGRFQWKHHDSQYNAFVASGTSSGPRVLYERTVPVSDDAVQLLFDGKIDMIDRLPPWQIQRVRSFREFAVGRYTIPNIHFLVPNLNKPLTGSRTFRRALLYGLNRNGMLEKLLERGGEGTVLSVPFVKGGSLGDSIGYAYDSSIQPRPYEPKLAIALSILALNDLRTRDPAWEKVDGMPELVLARPDHEIAEFIAMMIRRQWIALGIPVRIVEYQDAESIGRSDEIDFWLVERTIKEPLLDAERLFGGEGLLGAASPYMEIALEKLRRTENWPDAAKALHAVHRLCHEETTVLTLWQMTEHYARRATLEGVDRSEGIVDLYQHLDRWNLVGETEND